MKIKYNKLIMKGVKLDTDIGFAKNLIHTMQSYYPEELGCCLLVNVPFVFKLLWKLVSPIMDEQTLNKIKIINSEKLREVQMFIFSKK